MTETVRNLLWHAGGPLGASLLGRVTTDAAPSAFTADHRDPNLPPAVLEHAVRTGDARAVVTACHARAQAAGTPVDPDPMLRLLEMDDPDVNAGLFLASGWPALRMAVLSQRRFAPEPDRPAPTTDLWRDPVNPRYPGARSSPVPLEDPVPLAEEVRHAVLLAGRRPDLQVALAASDPDLVFWALVSGVPGPGGSTARLRACRTLAAAGRTAQLRRVFQVAPIEGEDAQAEVIRLEVMGSRTAFLVPKLLEEAYGEEALTTRLRAARRTSAARALVRGVLEPRWDLLTAAHAKEPLPWCSAVALLEHPRCPAGLRSMLLRAYPRALQMVPRPGPELLPLCAATAEDHVTKRVVLRGLEEGSLTAGDLVAHVRPARLALTSMVHGGLGALAAQAEAANVVRQMLAFAVASDPGVWQRLYTTLPSYDVTIAELIAACAHPSPGPALPPPRLGRQSAWAYTVLIGLLDADQAGPALEFLNDAQLAPLAGSPDATAPLVDHVVAHGGPVARRVLAANPHVRADVLETLVLGGDRAIASAAYRNPRCPYALREYIVSVDGFDDVLRGELCAAPRDGADPRDLWPLLASPDLAVLRAVALGSGGEFGHPARLRAAYRIAELHGISALEGLPDDPETVQARDAGGIAPLGAALRAMDERWSKEIAGTSYIPHVRRPGGVFSALADPGLAWPSVLAQARERRIPAAAFNLIAERPDLPLELAREQRHLRPAAQAWQQPLPSQDPTTLHGGVLAHHRPLVAEALRDAVPTRWHAPGRALESGVISPEEFQATAEANTVIDASIEHLPLARLVARTLHRELGENTDAWVVLARMLEQRPAATLLELVATARAAA
ncbi:hypothetical protein [Yinghuangia seranimata]|uniref:hypothetical protein n=1 Tax=Yinghuangia seranimata TaxID=408067 RepID=UPI00248D2E18|nr:hypothetical protein [Yinghuangia seranimata]MDI2127820.1 hypothetical protein [Yinghuangia seranimata]